MERSTINTQHSYVCQIFQGFEITVRLPFKSLWLREFMKVKKSFDCLKFSYPVLGQKSGCLILEKSRCLHFEWNFQTLLALNLIFSLPFQACLFLISVSLLRQRAVSLYTLFSLIVHLDKFNITSKYPHKYVQL